MSINNMITQNSQITLITLSCTNKKLSNKYFVKFLVLTICILSSLITAKYLKSSEEKYLIFHG